ncbi:MULTISPECIES: c-type cytochrome [unclassified Yoonia]|uniref:c-type cytochrome n=1 Tax=unclassified Yoonia TaxID=2629118 RepID=UPI002AFFD78F|nr:MULTISPECIES: c-type cytochrome [unclassified Yoonia]
MRRSFGCLRGHSFRWRCTCAGNGPGARPLRPALRGPCHGADLEGAVNWRQKGSDGRFPAPPHDETGHTWHHGDAMLFDYTSRGGQAYLDDLGVAFDAGMPSFGDILSDAEIEAILTFIKST